MDGSQTPKNTPSQAESEPSSDSLVESQLPAEAQGRVQGLLAEKRRALQLETLYDLTVALHSHRSEEELIDDLLQRVCAVVDPGTAAAVTRDAYGVGRTFAVAGWEGSPPTADRLLGSRLWQELLSGGRSIARSDGELAGRPFRQAVAAPLSYRGTFLGYLVILDKEVRARPAGGEDGHEPVFGEEDRRFLEAVAALAGVALDSLRQLESLVTKSEGLAEENKLLREQLLNDGAGQRIVANAPSMRRMLDVVERVAPRGVNVLVRGESGTGKELIAKLLHARSERTGPLVALNCAALPESLLESELFGIEGGVATGVEARVGKFELANKGTLFLDEIGDLEVSLQVKLLRALQEREITRVGASHSNPIDVRLIAATHRSLSDLIASGEFREDLFYRLKGVEIELPPLRERRQDIPHMVRTFIERFCEAEEIPVPLVEQDALALLLAHDYPGNVRELQNLVEGAVSLAEGSIHAELLANLLGTPEQTGPEALDLGSVETRHIHRVLKLTAGNKSAAAKLLGIDRRTLSRKGY